MQQACCVVQHLTSLFRWGGCCHGNLQPLPYASYAPRMHPICTRYRPDMLKIAQIILQFDARCHIIITSVSFHSHAAFCDRVAEMFQSLGGQVPLLFSPMPIDHVLVGVRQGQEFFIAAIVRHGLFKFLDFSACT